MPDARLYDPLPAARLLADLRRDRRMIEALPSAVAPCDDIEGAAVQHCLAGLTAALPPAGFKIGATSRTMQAYLGLAGPIAGFMPAASLHVSGASLPYNGFLSPGVECEIAVRLAADLPAGRCDEARAASAIGAVFTAIELVERRYGDSAARHTPTLIADQVFHADCVLGPPVEDWRGLDLAALPGRIEVDGQIRGTGIGADLLGHPLQALAWLAGADVVRRFGGLRAGQIVLLGSVTPPIWLARPGAVTVAFEPLPAVHLTMS